MPVKLTSTQYKIIAVTIAVAALSLAVAVKYFARAFPEASITFRVNRGDSEPIADRFLADRGFNVRGYQHAAVFDFSDNAKLYLERTQGLDRMNQLTRGPIHLWRWEHRWFRPQQKEEFRVDVTPAGQVVGFDHEIPEAAAGASLDQAAARKTAESFLTGVMKRDLGDLEFVDAVTAKRPARTDHAFTWKQKSVNLGDGSLRVEVEVDGNAVAGYRQYVKIPEQWSRDYERLRSRNDSAQVVDEVFWIALSVAMLAILILRLRDGDVPLRLAMIFGAIAAVLDFLGDLNTFSLAKFSYPTTDAYSSFLGGYVVRSALSAVGIGVAIFLLVASSEPMYREGLPRLMSLRRTFSWQGLRSRSFFMANVVGIGLTFFFFAYQTVFYLAANKLGAWAPADIPFSNELNTSIPWVAVLFTGFFPAVSEETQFRAFAIPFLKKIFKYWPIAVVLAAFNWGFLHSAYPNEPFFIRGVEVGIGGIIIGFIMLRFGIVATMIWHYSVDALYQAFLLLRSPNHYLMVSGALTAGIMLIPLIVALVAYLKVGSFRDEAGLSNEAQGISRPAHAAPPPTTEAPVAYRPLTPRRLLAAAIVVVIFVALAFIHVERFGEGLKVQVTRPEAIRVADAFLAQRHVAVGEYQRAAWLSNNVDPLALKYLLDYQTVGQADGVYRRATKLALWHVRYFKPLQKEEYLVFIDADADQVFAYRHEVDEDAPGASLTAEQARALAQQFLAGQGYQLSDFDLQDSESQTRKAREDYALTFQAKAGDPRNVADAHYRLEVGIAGGQVVSFVRHFKLPEAWVRQQERSGIANVVLQVVEYLLGAAIFAGFVWLLVRQIRNGAIEWRRALKLGVVLGLVFLLAELNQLPVLYQRYNTQLPLATFRLFVAVSYIVGCVGIGLVIWVFVGFTASLYPDAWKIFSGPARRAWRRDAVVAAIVGLAVGSGLSKLIALFLDRFHALAPVSGNVVPGQLDAWSPAAAHILRALPYCVLYAASAGFLIYLVRTGLRLRAWWLWAGIALLVASLGPSGAQSAAEYFVGWLPSFVQLVAAVVLVIVFFRDNVLAYIAVAFFGPLAHPLVELLSEGPAFFRWNGVALAVLMAVAAWWLFLPRGAATAAGGKSMTQ